MCCEMTKSVLLLFCVVGGVLGVYLKRGLFIRACYPELFDQVLKRRHVLLTGTPGIGKVRLSFSTERHMARRRLAQCLCYISYNIFTPPCLLSNACFSRASACTCFGGCSSWTLPPRSCGKPWHLGASNRRALHIQ